MASLKAPGMPGAGGMGDDPIAKIIPKDELEKLPSSVLQPGSPLQNLASLGSAEAGTPFQGFLGKMIGEVSAKQASAGAAMNAVITGGSMPLHQAMIAAEEASISFQLMVEVRNRLLESYQELMRMQV